MEKAVRRLGFFLLHPVSITVLIRSSNNRPLQVHSLLLMWSNDSWEERQNCKLSKAGPCVFRQPFKASHLKGVDHRDVEIFVPIILGVGLGLKAWIKSLSQMLAFNKI